MVLSQSASAPDLGAERRGSGSSSLKKAGAAALGGSSSQVFTTTLYEQMKSKGLFKNHFPNIPPAGKSINVPLNDSAQQDLAPEIFFPLPATPVSERKFRRISHGPGEICVHHGLKDQLLPAEDFRYGIRGQKGASTEDTMKAGLLLGVAAYQNEVAESIYESRKKEPLGRPWNRGHAIKMLPEGFGNPSGEPQNGKEVIYGIHQPPDKEEHRLLYKYTHNNFNPGERIERKYRWPAETKDSRFRFGHGLGQAQEGAGARLALNWDVEDDGSVRKTRLVQKNVEDFRTVQHTKVYHKAHAKQGANGPPLDPDFQHGVKSGISDYTAKSCIQGYYALEDQLPDQDLGRCLKPGRRNVTVATRAFGVPSVRTDIPAPPPDKRSIADNCSYGDECSAAALLNPQRFDDRGVPDRDFLIRRPKEELKALVESCDVEGVDFEALWEECVPLFDDGLPLVSLDAMLFVHTKKIEDRVAALHSGTGPGLAAYKGAL
ncbi:unnamed protein product [Durusdinium trenchii]|uniref:EFHB C-terminal EF-hand domain-containing protein n=1 Tax=Durusdinium trenchii TaxID=1381693 RepID=A0ABP0KLE4_9DINO